MRRQLNLILTLAGKDGRLFLADKRAALLGFAVPIVLASAFGIIFDKPEGGADGVRLPLLVVVEDEGAFTRSAAVELVASRRVEAQIVTRGEATERLANRRPGVAVVFPAGFETLATWKPGGTGPRPTVRVLYDPLCRSEAQWAEGIVSEVVMKKLANEKLSPLMADRTLTMPFTIESVEAAEGRAGFNSYSHSFCGMTLQYLLFWGMESGLSLLRDRQRSVWLRMRSAPVPFWCVLIGKALSTASIAFLQVLATFAFGYLVFGVCIGGSWIGFLLLALGVSVLAAATGLLVAAIGGTEARARSLSILAILGVSMLGGLWLPSFVLPGWARDLSVTLPTTWAMRGFDGVTWQGRNFWDSLVNVSAVAGFAALILSLAVARLVFSEARRRRGYA